MRVRKSAMGSVWDIGARLPARLGQARDVALVGDLAHADAAQAELAQVGARAPAPLAAVVVARGVLLRSLGAHDVGSLGHLALFLLLGLAGRGGGLRGGSLPFLAFLALLHADLPL